jgi:hypothetical protein
MAESSEATQVANGSDARKTALRAAAIAAASGATAIAAKRAFSQGGESGSSGGSNGGGSGKGKGGEGDSLVGGMIGSGWAAARDALVPFAADAAKAGGEYLAKNGPDVLRDTIVPSFIEGFQGADKSDDD